MAWTEMQKKAIYTRGSNIIVSAGAGSGKTAVLSERILDYCLQGNDIRKVLVLTFTNAAAQEMKERIRTKLLENNIIEQASLIDSASITTFDAYSLSLVKKYYYLLNVDKNITIIDEALLTIKRKEILDMMFDEFYQLKDEAFFSILKKYSKQNDDNIKKIILSLVDKLSLVVDEKEFYETYEERYFNKKFVDSLADEYEQLMLMAKNNLLKELEYLRDLSSTDEPSLKLFNDVNEMINRLNENNDYDSIALIKETLALPRINPKSSEAVKTEKSLCGDLIKDFVNKYFGKYLLLADAKEEIYSIKSDVLFLLKVALDLNSRLFDYKRQIMAFDYNDIAKMSIELVKNNQLVHAEITDNLNEILIDEYQDTSDIQEAFISLIANNNCYMVGDIKQSIYRFRNANPYIFKNKYDNYSLGNGGIKIDLTHNFRSRNEVLNNINMLFSSLMTNSVGDANYAVDHIMHYGQKGYEDLKQDINFDFEILSYESQEGFTDEEVEAFICGKEIIKLMESKPKCLKGKEFKDITYSDIAILIDKTKSFIIFKKIFEYLGIPLSIEADLDLNDSILPKLISNILLLISKTLSNEFNEKYYHALASVARSFLCEYPDEIVYKLCNDNLENELTEKIKRLALAASNVSTIDLFYKIIEEFNFYEKLELIGDIENSLVIIDYIYSLFKTMHNAQMSLMECSGYLSNVFDAGIQLKYKLSKPEGASVRIMTIHKSKGLEFPYCYFPMLGSSFNKSEFKEAFGLSTKYGVFIPFSDEGNSNTIIKDLVVEDLKKADISEKVRLLYVALTRAREKMILISNNKEYNPNCYLPSNYGCFNHMLRSKDFIREFTRFIDVEKLNVTKDYKLLKKKEELISGEGIFYNAQDFASEILDKKQISKELNELVDEGLKKAIDQGLLFHECLEVIDFKNPNIDILPIPDNMKIKLKKILNLAVFKNIAKAKTYHEYEFYYKDYHGIIDLFCVYDDHIDIIDYKLANIDKDEYYRQLAIYKEYISSISPLKVNCYLLSILRNEIKQII